jgi:hypothetical protein
VEKPTINVPTGAFVMKQTYSETQVRGGETLGVMRYVLAASMMLGVAAMSSVFMSFV